MSSEEAGRASQGAIYALLRALGEGNRDPKKPNGHFPAVLPEVIVPKQRLDDQTEEGRYN